MTPDEAPDEAPVPPERAPSEAGLPADEGAGARARRFVRRHRVRLTRLVLVAFGVVVLVDLTRVLPTETNVVLPLGASHAEAVALSIEVLDEAGDPTRSVRLRYEAGAPATLEQTLDLPPGRYVVHVEAERSDGSRFALEGPLEVPSEGTVRVPLARVP